MSDPRVEERYALTKESLDRDSAWIQSVCKMPCARILLDHLAAFDTTICCGGVKGIEPPMEQTSSWRRAFCYEYSKTDRPFNIVSSCGRKLPKCIAICQLSGKNCMFYTESNTLAKVLCLSVQECRESITDGIHAIIEKAEEMDASVLVTLCLPFQVGLERAYWDIRTIRKTTKNAIKDGELAFASGDEIPRTVPCTRSLDHWQDAVLSDVSKALGRVATAVCLDYLNEGDSKKMDPDAMEGVIEMLKADRRKIIESNKTELASIHEKHKCEVQKMLLRVEDAEHEANMRIAKVAYASKNAEEVLKKKDAELASHNITLREQVLALEKGKEILTRDFNASNLKNEEETKKAAARQKTLEAQVISLKSNVAKTAADWAKQRKDIKEDERSRKKFENRISELTNTLQARNAAFKAVEASAREAWEAMEKTQGDLLERDSEVAKLRGIFRGYKVVLKLAAVRLDDAVERSSSAAIFYQKEVEVERQAFAKVKDGMQTTMVEMMQTINKNESMVLELQNSSRSKEKTEKKDTEKEDAEKEKSDVKSDELANVNDQLKEAKQEIGRKQHLLSETDKRVKYLERALKESDEEVAKLTSALDLITKGPHNGNEKSDKESNKSQENEVSVNVNQNTAVYMQQPLPHQQALPQTHFNVDPHLENTISALYSALNVITATARSACTNGKNAEVAHAKLDALALFGIVPPQQQQMYYERQLPQQYAMYH